MNDRWRGMLLVGALLGLGALGDVASPAVALPHDGRVELGAGWELRRMAAQVMWVDTERFLHSGVEEREAESGEDESRAEEYHSHGGEAHVWVIPPKREDFRGILGDVEREIKPYMDREGKVRELTPDQLTPLYRVITWSDPHFVQGWINGAFAISRAGKPGNAAESQRVEQAIAFLKDGERWNPGSFEIQMELGHFYFYYWKMYAQAEEHLRRALALAPRGRKLNEIEQEALVDTYRWLALDYSYWAHREEAVAVAKEGLRVLGEDSVLQHVIERKGKP